jgi:uncharacterized protein (UPF0305 family)
MVQSVGRGGSLRDECKIKNRERDQKDSLCDFINTDAAEPT